MYMYTILLNKKGQGLMGWSLFWVIFFVTVLICHCWFVLPTKGIKLQIIGRNVFVSPFFINIRLFPSQKSRLFFFFVNSDFDQNGNIMSTVVNRHKAENNDDLFL